jgi:Ca2+-binding RTX toxin-like protein
MTATAANEILNITGAQSMTITGAVTADTINASGMTGNGFLSMGAATTAAGGVTITGSLNGDTLVASANSDIINSGAGNDVVTGLAGADVINVGTGTDRVVYSATTQTFGTTVVSGTTVLSASIDTITGMSAGDVITLFTGAGVSATTAISSSIITSAGVDTIALVRGNYSTSTGIWTSSASGTDTLLMWDNNGATANGTVESIVLVGTVNTSATLTADTITLL